MVGGVPRGTVLRGPKVGEGNVRGMSLVSSATSVSRAQRWDEFYEVSGWE